MSRWYRAYSGTVRDDKLAECAVIAGCSRSVVIATWHAVLESAADAMDGGRFETSARRVAAILGEPLASIDAVFSAMSEVGLFEGDTIPAWKARQFESDNSTERSRKHREAKRNTVATLQQRCATPPYTETETERSDDALRAPPASIALAKIEPACLAIVAGTSWPVETAQDWHALTRLAVDEGLDVETEIIPAIRQQSDRARQSGKRIGTWGYFANGCREFARQARSPPQPMPSSVSHFPQSRNGNRHDPRANTIENALARLKNIAGGGDASDFADGRPMRTINATAEPG